jgi:hypothetical protein
VARRVREEWPADRDGLPVWWPHSIDRFATRPQGAKRDSPHYLPGEIALCRRPQRLLATATNSHWHCI